jgi:RHS repeat-associated protein
MNTSVQAKVAARVGAGVAGLMIVLLGAPDAAAQATQRAQRAPGISALGSPRSVAIAPSVGALTERFPLEVAPGRHEVAPRMALSYASLGGLAQLGAGWQLDPGRIERSVKNGVPGFTDSDTFAFSLQGSASELTAIGGGRYRAKQESQFQQFTFDGTRWEMRLGSGVVYRFGTTDASRASNAIWMLDGIEDLNGNTVSYSYERRDGVLYPTEIRYTGYAPTGDPGANRVVLEYEDRPDVRITYMRAAREETRRRLSRISVFAGDALVRRFGLEHEASPSNGVSLLRRIRLTAADDTASVVAREYGYQARDPGWNTGALAASPPRNAVDGDGKEKGVRYADVNGDGRADLVDNGVSVLLGDGLGHFADSPVWTASLTAANVRFVDGDGVDQGVQLLDINGDLRPDLVIARLDRRQVYLNDGNGWTLDSAFSASLGAIQEQVEAERRFIADGGCNPDAGLAPDAHDPCDDVIPFIVQFSVVQANGDSTGAHFVDVNGDALPDIVWSFKSTTLLFGFPTDAGTINRTPAEVRVVYLNTGSGFAKDQVRTDSLHNPALDPFIVDSQTRGYDVLDVNGDGLADIIRTLASAERVVFLNNGLGWARDEGYTASLAAATDLVSLDSDLKAQGLYPIDLDGDGLLDYIRADESTTVAYVNTGTGFRTDAALTQNLIDLGVALADGDGKPQGYDYADIDGDGLTDLIRAKDGVTGTIRLARGPAANLMITARTALGEITDVSYAPSSAFDNTGGDGIQDLPTVLTIPVTLTRRDGRGNAFPTTARYAGGAMIDRELRGFATAALTDSRGVTQRMTFDQGAALKGSLRTAEMLDAGSVLRSRRTLGFQTPEVLPGVTQLRATQIDDETFDDAGTLHVRTRTGYDDFLNIVEVIKDGDVTVAGDESRTTIAHVRNDALGITDPPSRVSIFDAGGALVSVSVMLYDGLPEGQAARGNVTATTDAVQIGGATVTRNMAYDAFGNLQTVVDRNGGTSSFDYDDATHTFKVAAHDPLGRTIRTAFDARFGTATRNEDANGQVTTRRLDAFGRLTVEVQPGDETSPFGTRTIVYSDLGDPNTQHVQVRATETQGQPGTFDTDTLFDGFGQVYRIQAEGEGGRVVVTSYEFDEKGLPVSFARPRFSTEAASITTYERDALDRPIRTTDVDGVSQLMSYAGPLTEIVDRRGNHTQLLKDAFERLLEQREVLGTRVDVTRQRYDSQGHTIEITSAAGEVTHIAYDALGRRTRLDDPALGTFQYAYDANDNLVRQVDPTGRVTTYDYDAVGELRAKHLPDGFVETFTYDGGGAGRNTVGRLSHVDDRAGALELSYDGRGNVVEKRRTIDRDTYVTAYGYDSMSRRRMVLYPDGARHDFTYNAASFLESIADETGRAIVQSADYTAQGRLASIQYGNNVVSTLGYDQLARLNSVSTSGPGGVLQDLRQGYDLGGNVTAISDLAFGRSQGFSYDAKNRLTFASGPYGAESYEYTPIGTLLRKGSLLMDVDPAHPQQVRCGVDLELQAANKNGLARDPRLLGCIDALIARGLSPADQAALTTIRSRSSKGNVAIGRSFAATYDALGNTVEKNGVDYLYDPENHLAEIKDNPGVDQEENVYDATGARVIRKARTEPDKIFIDDVFEIDQHRALKHVRLGNLLLATISEPAHTVHLISAATDDPLVASVVAAHGCGSSSAASLPATGLLFIVGMGTVFVRGRGRHAERLRRRMGRARRQLAATIRGVPQAARRRPIRFWIGVVLAPAYLMAANNAHGAMGGNGNGNGSDRQRFEERFFYHTDHVGSVNVVSDDSGREVQRREYRPFGELFVDNGGQQPHGPALEASLDGQRLDAASGLYYFGARHYDPVMGRFLSGDTQVPRPDIPQSMHRYAFNLNNPIRYVDLTGHGFLDILVDVLLVLAVIAAVVITFIPGVGQAVGPFLTAIALGALIGAFAGAVIGGIVALTLLALGKISLKEAFTLWNASIFVGFLAGASIGAIAVGGLGAAPLSAKLLTTTTLIGATTGALTGGTLGAIKERGFTDGFASSLLIGAAIGAVTGFAMGALGPGIAESWTPTVSNIFGIFGGSVTEHAFLLFVLSAGTAIVSAAAVAGFNCSPAGNGECVFSEINPFVKSTDPSKRELAQTSSPLVLNTQPLVQ